MTEPVPFDDDVLSAALDGEVSADDVARLETDPDAARRLDELRAVRTAVAEAVDVPVGAADRAVAAALAARIAARADTAELQAIPGAAPEVPVPGDDQSAAPTGAAVVSLDQARTRRGHRLAPVLGAAATVLFLVVAAVAVWSGNRTSTVDSVAAPSTTSGADTAAAAGAPSAPGVGATRETPVTESSRSGSDSAQALTVAPLASTTTVSPAFTDTTPKTTTGGSVAAGSDLGSFESPIALAAEARADAPPMPALLSSDGTAVSAPAPCPAPPDQTLLWWARATLQGQPVVVALLALPTDAIRLVAVDPVTCSVVVELGG